MNTITTELNKERYCLVQVPNSQRYFDIFISSGQQSLVWNEMIKPGKFRSKNITLPVGSWIIIGVGKDLSEEQWKEITPRYDGDDAWCPTFNDPDSGGHGFCYQDFISADEHGCYYTATESGKSFLTSLGATEDFLILKEVK